MKDRLYIGFFWLLVIAQLAAPAALILEREWVLRNGEAFRFRLQPVDPYDPFRGRYVALSFKAAEVSPKNLAGRIEDGQKLYAALSTDQDGFAVVSDLSPTPPASGPYLTTWAVWWGLAGIRLRFPFDRYYMEESAAPEAERLYWRATRSGQDRKDAFAVVRILSGKGVIENLYIENCPIREYLREKARTSSKNQDPPRTPAF